MKIFISIRMDCWNTMLIASMYMEQMIVVRVDNE